MDTEVICGSPEDIDLWMTLVAEVRWNFPGLETQEALDDHQQTVLKFMAKQQALCVKIRDAIVGVLLFSRDHNMICCLAVSPSHRKLGIGTKLLQTALSKLDHSKPITVSTFREGDEKAAAPRTLYQKFSFVPGQLVEELGYPCQIFTLPPISQAVHTGNH